MWKVTVCVSDDAPIAKKYVDSYEDVVEYIKANYPPLMNSEFQIHREGYSQWGTGYFWAQAEGVGK